ncbi:FAD dependent oxidoreductase [Truncatella angustata]|uniref:FAD dependent oxidoreductase n=1 Tax=Truncatella angustata TaxID=152316 RepID=A0A9P8RHR1_9PEZI|nr:FAD dependent oxidoreductase [Truncatella angustata]KAH6638583.1 FAD dependent oxidoreductase [Truncatella angustata]
MALDHDSKILIVGSGVFGISTALWLARSGYRDITVFDMQDTYSTGYDPAEVDSASADLNKIIRFSYGDEIEYQRLAFEAAKLWEEWNGEIASADESQLPEVLQKGARKLWWNCGYLRMSETAEYDEFELTTLENMKKEGIRESQFMVDDASDVERAKQLGWGPKLDPCRRVERLGVHKAVLDASGGFVVAYKSCAWAQHLARKAGVKLILHPSRGKVVDLGTRDGRPRLETADKQVYAGDLVIVSGGGWTQGLVPETAGLLETTAGSVATIHIPEDRSDLRERFSPSNFPVISWSKAKGIYALPLTENGDLKIGYRRTKYTNFEEVDGRRISVPKTAHVTEQKETNITLQALRAVQEFVSVNMPELVEFGISSTKLCWYTDSIDNSFVVDFVPGRPGVVVCSGGSGHGFKFLPILGREVVTIIESCNKQTVYGEMWKWRKSDKSTRNGLEEGEAGSRLLAKQTMAKVADWAPGKPEAVI